MGTPIAYYSIMNRAGRIVIFFLLSLALTASAAESCNSIFLSLGAIEKAELDKNKTFEIVDSLEAFQALTKHLLEKRTDIESLITALEKTQFAYKSNWRSDDILFFILHQEKKYGLNLAAEKFQNVDLELVRKLRQQENDLLALISTEFLNKEQRDHKIRTLLLGTDIKNPDLLTSWQVNNPEEIKQYFDYFHLSPQGSTLHYVMDPNADHALKSVKRFVSMPFPDHRFFDSVYKNYADRIREEIVRLIKKVEDALPVMRQSYGMVHVTHDNSVAGTMRVFDGTLRRLNHMLHPEYPEDSPVLPFEAIFKARNIPVNFIKKLEQMRVNNPYQPIFEIGKLSLEGSASVRDRSIKALEFFLLHYFLNHHPNAIIVIHVASEAHLSLYQKRYGFEVAETVAIPQSEQVEHILTLSAEKFRKALNIRLGL